MFAKDVQSDIDPIKKGRFTEQIRQSRLESKNGLAESGITYLETTYYYIL